MHLPGVQRHPALVVVQILRPDASKVRLRLIRESDGSHRRPSFEKSASNTVHPVHQLAFRAKNHGIPKIRLLNEFHVSHKNPDRCRFPICAKPIHSVQFTDVSETHLLNRQVGREFDKTMNVPGVISLIGRLKEVLPSHGLQYPAAGRLEACPTDPALWGRHHPIES